jgi:hypothetical protein
MLIIVLIFKIYSKKTFDEKATLGWTQGFGPSI